MNIFGNHNIFSKTLSSREIIDKNIETQEILEDKNVRPEKKLDILSKEIDKTLKKAENYLIQATQEEKDYNLKNHIANKGLGCITKAEMQNKKYKNIAKDNFANNNQQNKIQTYRDKKNKIDNLHLQLLQQAYAIKVPKRTLDQMTEFFNQKIDCNFRKIPVARLDQNFEKGFMYTIRSYNSQGIMKIYEDDLNDNNSKFRIRVNLEDDPVLVDASNKLNKNLKKIDKIDSMEIAKALLETESDFFKPELITKSYSKNGTTYTCDSNENEIVINGEYLRYAEFKHNKAATRIIDVGEFSKGGFGLPKATGVCDTQSLFLKAMAQLSGINTSLMMNKNHGWNEYKSKDGNTFVIDSRNKLIFDLNNKIGLEYDMYEDDYIELSPKRCNRIFDELYNTCGDLYEF
ncbi:MAG: hypothetical protein WCK67_10450 [bacterium]